MSDEHFSLSPTAPPPPTEADYEAIAAAVMETLRGRWFLAEFAKRNRNADTELIPKRKRTIAHLPKSVRTALGKRASSVAKKKRKSRSKG